MVEWLRRRALELLAPLRWGLNPMRGSCQLLTGGCWFTHMNNLFLQLWKLTAIYNQTWLNIGIKHQFNSTYLNWAICPEHAQDLGVISQHLSKLLVVETLLDGFLTSTFGVTISGDKIRYARAWVKFYNVKAWITQYCGSFNGSRDSFVVESRA